MARWWLILALIIHLPCLKADETSPSTDVTKEEKKKHPLAGMKFRSLGPALMSGRVVGLAVHPENRARYYAAVASGGVWKTENAGVSWKPVFDGEGSYSIGCVVLDPQNSNTVWVGTGENNSQRSVGYGDGVYKSIDAGLTWKNMGLKSSEHIGKIQVHPHHSDIVYVAAQGPLWASEGDRGLYKTTDGGRTWECVLKISENTGITDFVINPQQPDIIVAASYQRRRHVWTLVNGGPESALHRSTDGGKTWTKIRSGLPTSELGRIGLAIAPSDPNVLYATVEAAEKMGGIFRSNDGGITWQKQNSYDQTAMYYSHLVVDPIDKNRIYIMNVYIQVSDDGGKTIRPLGERYKHVDSHAMWIDPKQPDYYLVGCDGGIYESHDRAANWRFIPNLPVTQFYDITCEQINSPFYRVYGGTQDNNTIGGPARTMSGHGIMNSDWHIIVGGDGFHCRVDPQNRNIVYAEYQYGGLVRYDWRTGQRVNIQPLPPLGENGYRWNWDSPFIISPHSSTRIYFAANKVFRSDDRGDNWKVISPDLTRELDRDRLKVFGKIQSPEAVAKHASTSLFGNITALAESYRKEGLLYAGTDDGLIQISDNGGTSWTRVEKFPGVPDQTYVARLLASQHDATTLYAAFDNHKMGDFAPYLLKSTDAGKSWISVTGDLPARGSVLAIAEDHVNPQLLFVGTEFGLYFTQDGGNKWHAMRNGLPTIAVRDLVIQQPMNDLIVGTFGRGMYVLDDYSPLRESSATFEQPAALLKPRDGFLYMPTQQYGGRGKASLGEEPFQAENPSFGVSFTAYLKEAPKTLKQKRKEQMKLDETAYPKLEELRAETEEENPALLLAISNKDNQVVRIISAPATAGMQRIVWDMRLPAVQSSRRSNRDSSDEEDLFASAGGPYAVSGIYRASLFLRTSEATASLARPVEFEVKYVGAEPLSLEEQEQVAIFQQQVIALQRELAAVQGLASDISMRLDAIKSVLDQAPNASLESRDTVRKLQSSHRQTLRNLQGDTVLRERNENTPVSIAERVRYAAGATRTIIQKPTGTEKEQFTLAKNELTKIAAELKSRLLKDVKELENYLDKLGAPWTPGRVK